MFFCLRPPGRTVGVDSKLQWSHFFQTNKLEAIEMGSEFGHLGLSQLETEDQGDVRIADSLKIYYFLENIEY